MVMRKVVAIIPARMASSRFPGKPLVNILGLPMIEHVRRRVSLCDGIEVYVATCDHEIRTVVESHGGKVIMTSDKHLRCTDRIEEAVTSLDADIVVNVQGDEPTVVPQAVTEVSSPLQTSDAFQCSCLIYPLSDLSELQNPNVVKTVISREKSILYFSRSPIPYVRENGPTHFFKQSGIMAFRKDFLHLYSRLSATPLEIAESVDMLRVLEHSYKILGIPTTQVSSGVDVPEDVRAVEEILKGDVNQNKLYKEIIRR
ncbi:MAG: 3-deoxy-manno-octulosonate cytidylyltransferase [Thermodesulfobacteriota bacterium]